MLLTLDKRIYEKALVLRDHGMSRSKRYWHEAIGFNYRMTNLQAALGVAQMETFDEIIQRKKDISLQYNMLLSPFLIRQSLSHGCISSYWLNSYLLPDSANRSRFITYCQERGVEVRRGFYPLSAMPIYSSYDTIFSSHSTTNLSNLLISLPSSPNLSSAEIEYVCKTTNQFF